MEHHQLDLFSDSETRATPTGRPDRLLMDSDALVRWKSQIAAHQKLAGESKPALQGTLFDLTPTHTDSDAINPFSLTLQSMAFWRWPADSPGLACLYFVIDTAMPLLLYVGETCNSNLRWKGAHDCKRYLENYHSLHYQHGIQTAVNVAFWWNAPVKTQDRQQLEAALIAKWRSPFNKENWIQWGKPFG